MQLSRNEGHPDHGGSTQRCGHCDADVLFLSTCPACGMPTGNGESPATYGNGKLLPFAPVGPARKGPEMAQVLTLADAARARNNALEEQLVKTWREPPTHRPRSDDWNAGRSAGARVPGSDKKLRSGRKRLVLFACLGAALVAGAVGLGLSESLSSPPTSNSTTALTPTRFDAGGAAFEALFPSVPITVSQRLSFAGRPYVAYSYATEQGSTALSVGVYALPIGPIPPGVTQESLARGFLRSAGSAGSVGDARARAGATTRVGNLPGVTIAGTGGSGTAAAGTLVFDGHILYEILAVGPANGLAASLQHFQAHFRVVDWRYGFRA